MIRIGKLAWGVKNKLKGLTLAGCIDTLRRHPRLFSLVHKVGIFSLRVPVIVSGKMRKYGWKQDENTKELEKYKNSHLGERCVLVANGPSLISEDLDKIKHEWTFGCNKIYYMFPKTSWRPDFYCVLDERYIERSQDEIFSRLPCLYLPTMWCIKKSGKKIRRGERFCIQSRLRMRPFKPGPIFWNIRMPPIREPYYPLL